MKREFELMLISGKRIIWEGKDGLDACQRFADTHPGETVFAWREYPRHGVFVGAQPIVE